MGGKAASLEKNVTVPRMSQAMQKHPGRVKKRDYPQPLRFRCSGTFKATAVVVKVVSYSGEFWSFCRNSRG